MEEQVIGESLQKVHRRPRAYVLNCELQLWCGLLREGLNFHLVLRGGLNASYLKPWHTELARHFNTLPIDYVTVLLYNEPLASSPALC